MKKQNKTGALAITQILLLIIGIMAISYAIGSSVVVVSASAGDCGDGGTCINIDTEHAMEISKLVFAQGQITFVVVFHLAIMLKIMKELV